MQEKPRRGCGDAKLADGSPNRAMWAVVEDLNRLKRLRVLKRLEGLRREDLLGMMYAVQKGGGSPPRF